METKKLNELRSLDRSKAYHILTDRLGEGTQMLAYSAAYIISKCNGHIPESFDAFLSEYDVKAQISPILYNETSNKWEQLSSLATFCPVDEFTAFLLFENIRLHCPRQEATPTGVCQLASKVLKIEKWHRTADLCTGTGNFIRECIADGAQGNFFGNDIDMNFRIIAMMRADILDSNITISAEDTFRISKSFDRIFCNYPFNMRIRELDRSANTNTAADWYFVEKCVSLLEEKGKAVCIMTNGSTWNMSDKDKRKEFVE